MSSICDTSDLLVFSHLRWDFEFQRPQHLLTRFAKYRRVFYFEGPIFGMTDIPRLHLRETQEGVQVVVPYLPADTKEGLVDVSLKELVEELLFEEHLSNYTLWYCTSKALDFTRHLNPRAVIYDSSECPTPSDFAELERELFSRADLVFTGDHSLFESKKCEHRNLHHFPNCIDYAHFSQARLSLVEPDDQINIPRPRIGFNGTIDDNFDLNLLEQMARKRPDYQFILIGPCDKIGPSELPRLQNIFYLDKQDHHALPLYFSGWDCAMMPLTHNDPTTISEYLAAGRPVVSTPDSGVLGHFAEKKLVHFAASADEFLVRIEKAMEERSSDPEWLGRVDAYLSTNSWDRTWEAMANLEKEVRERETREVLEQIIDHADHQQHIQ